MTLTQKLQEAEKARSGALVDDAIEGIDLRTASVRQVYCEMVRVWHEVAQLFALGSPGTLPTLAMYEFDGKNDLRVYFSPAADAEDEEYTRNLIHKMQSPTAVYDSVPHMVLLNRCAASPEALVEEVTHSLINPEMFRTSLPIEQLKEYSGRYCLELYNAARSLGKPKSFYVIISEFFPPIALQSLLGRTNNSEMDNPEEFRRTHLLGTARHNQFMIIDWLNHLPQVAGERLVRNYGGDVHRLLQEHPELTSLSGTELWYNYCRPLLVSGKVDGDWIKR